MKAIAVAMTILLSCAWLGAAASAAKDDYIWKANLDPSKVTIQAKDAKLADVLKALADQSGNALLAPPEKWVEKPVTVDVKGATFFEALDAIAAAAGLNYDLKGLTVEPALTQKDVGTYLGPVAVKAARLTKTRSIRDASYPQSSGLQVEIYCFRESRLPVFCESCIVKKVTDADGHQLQMHRPPAGRAFSTAPAAETPGLAGTKGFAMLDSVPAKLPGTTVTIEGVVELGLGAGEKVLTISKVLADGADLSVTEGDVSFTVKKVQTWGKGGGVFYGFVPNGAKNPISFIVELKSEGKVPLALGGVGSPYGVFIADPKGKRYPVLGTTGSQAQKDDAWTATIFPAFDKPEGMDDTWSLIYVCPEKTETKQWPFEIKDAPLP